MTGIIFADDTSTEMRDEVLRLAEKWKPNKRTKLIQGHGINDADYMTQVTTIYGTWYCPIYQKWMDILKRVYSPSVQKKYPTYVGTQLDPEWLSFMAFRSWCLLNGWRSDYQLDKDFISDSKIYGPDTCAFIPSNVNTFIIERGAARGEYPIGVSRFGNKLQSHCCNPFAKKQEWLGYFATPEEAHLAWKQKKHEHALALADMYPDLDPRVLHALRTKYIN
ncbi:hypothetical protein G8O18_14125 [Enterobacter kobei]|uniref:hypothetical protein n=1 Tax=Enterobacter kobei TaxID=208224 RepID=UPI002F34D37E